MGRTFHGNNFKRTVLCAVLIIVALLCLCGCRSRIMDIADVDEVIADQGGIMQQQYEQQREELQLEPPQKPLLQKTAPVGTPANNSNAPQKPGTGGNGGNGDGGNDGTGNGGEGNKPDNTEDPDEQKIVVTFDAAGGTVGKAGRSSITKKYTVGSAYNSLPKASWSGHTFLGWYTDASSGERVLEESTVPAANLTLYAHYTQEETFTITFDPGEGRIKAKDKSRVLAKGDAFGTFPTVLRDGYDLEGWFTAPGNDGEQVFESDVFAGGSDMTLYAHWTYDPEKYWSDRLTKIRQGMYSCQVIDCYIEFDTDHVTQSSCSLLSDCKAGNIARNRGSDTTVTDEWVNEKQPAAIIKCTSGNASSKYAAMASRFPGKRILVLPSQAVSGSNAEQIYYRLYLGKTLYPDWFNEVDMSKVSSELGVNGSIYQ